MLRSLRRSFWFFKAFLEKYLKVIILSLVLGISAARFGHLLPTPKKTLKVGLVGRYTTENLPMDVLSKISRGLVKTNSDGSPSPDLAESWEIKEEEKLYIFHLKKGIFWQDETPLKAKDVRYDLEDIEIRTKNDHILEFTLKEPFSPFPNILSQPIFKKGLLGVGKYKVTAIKSSGKFIQSIKLTNEETSLIYKFYPTEKAAILGFKLGEVNRLEKITNISDLENWPKIRVIPEIDYRQFVAVFYNTKSSQFSQKTIRQALTYALKKPSDETRALGPFNPNSWAYNSQVKPYEQDILKAKSLLEEAEVKNLEIELATTFSQLPFAETIKNSWEESGIKTKIKVVSTLPETFQAFLASQEIPADPDQYTLWHSTQSTNITGYNNPKIDKLLEDGRKISDEEERKAIYLDFQRFLVEDTPAAFLFYPTVYTIIR